MRGPLFSLAALALAALALAAAVPQAAQAAGPEDWRPVTVPAGAPWAAFAPEYDWQSIRQEGPNVITWVRLRQTGADGSVTHPVRARLKIDCTRQMNTTLEYLQADESGAMVALEGQSLYAAPNDPGSIQQGVYATLCGRDAVTGRVARVGPLPIAREPFLGATVRPLSAAESAAQGLPAGTGVMVTQVTANGPAQTSGIAVGDVVLAMGGTNVTTAMPLPALIARNMSGEWAELDMIRHGEVYVATVTFAEMPR